MARYVRDLVLNKPDDFVQFMMNDYLQKNSFIMSEWKGEAAYRAGDAMMEGYKYLKWYYRDGVFHLEAWLKGTFGGEWDLRALSNCLRFYSSLFLCRRICRDRGCRAIRDSHIRIRFRCIRWITPVRPRWGWYSGSSVWYLRLSSRLWALYWRVWDSREQGWERAHVSQGWPRQARYSVLSV